MFGLVFSACIGLMLLVASSVGWYLNEAAHASGPSEPGMPSMVLVLAFPAFMILADSVWSLIALKPWRRPVGWKRAPLRIAPTLLPIISLSLAVPVVVRALAVYDEQHTGNELQVIDRQTCDRLCWQVPGAVALVALFIAASKGRSSEASPQMTTTPAQSESDGSQPLPESIGICRIRCERADGGVTRGRYIWVGRGGTDELA